MGSWFDDTNYQLGLSPTSLMTLRDMGVPVPDQVIFRDSSVLYTRADLKRVGDGYSSFIWVWDVISIAHLSTVLSFLGGEENVYLYAVTDKRDGTYPAAHLGFSLYYAMMWKPQLSGEEGVPIARSQMAMQTVKLEFVHAVEQSGYEI